MPATSPTAALPVRHLSIRVPWHDAGWDGTVCRQPADNGSCLVLERIQRELVARGLPGLDGHKRTSFQFAFEARGHRANAFGDFLGPQTLDANANHGRSHRTGNCKNRVKIRIKRHDDGVLPEREPKNFLIGGC